MPFLFFFFFNCGDEENMVEHIPYLIACFGNFCLLQLVVRAELKILCFESTNSRDRCTLSPTQNEMHLDGCISWELG